MKKRIQVSAGPKALKLVLKIARKTNLETGVAVTAVDVLEGASTMGINQMAARYFPKEKGLASLRE